MVSIPEPHIAADRFALYVEELQEFARSYKMTVGSPNDLRALRTALDGPGAFREECASMMRSIVYRERGQAPTEELLALVAAAWGGNEVNAAASALQEPIGRIVIFLSGVMRIQRDSPPPLPMRGMQVEVTEPVAEYGRLPPRPLGIFASAVETAAESGREVRTVPVVQEKTQEKKEVAPADDLEATLQSLAAESPDVRLYLQLLKQREEDRKTPSVSASATARVVLNERPSQLASPQPVEMATAKEDPWAPNSELQKELRRFAAQKAAKAAAYRRAKAARPPHIKVLFAVEAVLFRFAGSDNFVRRYLSDRLELQGPERWKV